jgi:hypothetical protein
MPEYAPVVDDYWTVDWFMRMVMTDNSEAPDTKIGAATVRGSI